MSIKQIIIIIASVLLLMVIPVYANIPIFSQTFESGNGTFNSSAITGSLDWGRVTGCSYADSWSYKTGACGANYVASANEWLGFNQTVEINRNVNMTFYGSIQSEAHFDGLHLEVYNGTAWNIISNSSVSPAYNDVCSGKPCWAGTQTETTQWRQYTVNLTSAVNTSTGFLGVRFVFTGDAGLQYTGAKIDNVELFYVSTPPILEGNNSKTLNNTQFLTVNISEVVNFSVTSDQIIDYLIVTSNNVEVSNSTTPSLNYSFSLTYDGFVVTNNTFIFSVTNNSGGTTNWTWYVTTILPNTSSESAPPANSSLNITQIGAFPYGISYTVDTNGSYMFAGEGKYLGIYTYENISNPLLVSGIVLDGEIHSVIAQSDFVYIATRTGFRIVNISNITNPTLEGTIDSITHNAYATKAAYDPVDMGKQGNYVYVGAGMSYGIVVYNVTNPANPTEESFVFSEALGIAVNETRLYAGDYSTGRVSVYNKTDPANLTLISIINTSVTVTDCARKRIPNIEKDNNTLYVSMYGWGLDSINITNELNPEILGYWGYNSCGERAWGMKLLNSSTAYLAMWYEGLYNINISDPGNMTGVLLDSYISNDVRANGYNYGVALAPDGTTGFMSGKYLMVNIFNLTANAGIVSQITPRYGGIFSMAGSGTAMYALMDGTTMAINNVDPANPTYVSENTEYNQRPPGSLVIGDYLYIAAGNSYGLDIYDVTNPLYPVYVTQFNNPDPNSVVNAFNNKLYYVNGYLHAGNDKFYLILDISNPIAPSVVGYYNTSTDDSNGYQDMATGGYYTEGNYTYTVGGGQFKILDINDPANITMVSNLTIDKPAGFTPVVKYNDLIYIKSLYRNLVVINVSNKSSPTIINNSDIGYIILSFAIANNTDDTVSVLAISSNAMGFTKFYNLTDNPIPSVTEASYNFVGTPYYFGDLLYMYHENDDSGYEVYQLFDASVSEQNATTDSYYVSVNGGAWNYSTVPYVNVTSIPHGWINTSVMAHNNTYETNSTAGNYSIQIPNNVPVLDAIGNKTVTVDNYLNITLNAADADGDNLSYGSNMTLSRYYNESFNPWINTSNTTTMAPLLSESYDFKSYTITFYTGILNLTEDNMSGYVQVYINGSPAGELYHITNSTDNSQFITEHFSIPNPTIEVWGNTTDSGDYIRVNTVKVYDMTRVSWKPTASDAGVYYVNFNVSDGYSGLVQENITITVPSIYYVSHSPESPLSISQGTNQSFTLNVSQPATVIWNVGSSWVKTQTSTKNATYYNSTLAPGFYYVYANATDESGIVYQQWNLTVNGTSTEEYVNRNQIIEII